MHYKILIERDFSPTGQLEYKAVLSEMESTIITDGVGRSPSEALRELITRVDELLNQCVDRLKDAPDIMLKMISPKDLRLMADCIEFLQGQQIKTKDDEG